MDLEELFKQYKEQSIEGRYITLDHIQPLLDKLNTNNQTKIIGKSVLNKPIYSSLIGTGETRIYMWSQMHGDESTTTKALFDFLNVLNGGSEYAQKILKTFTFYVIPILNPDGAKLYTRENANGVDLNRDAQDLSQPESRFLRQVFDEYKPHYCFNLHDQRTIYAVGDTKLPATVAFLAPAYNEEREVNESRLKAINLIVRINDVLKKYIPGQIGRFNDAFNGNCMGDTFQLLGASTILFEAGHYPNDYQRENTRKFIFFSLIVAFEALYENDLVDSKMEDYLKISQNKTFFYDFMYKNVKINYDGVEIITNFVAQYKEELIKNEIHFNAYIAEVGKLENYYGHHEYDAKGATYSDDFDNFPKLGQKASFYLDKKNKFVNGLIKN